MKTDELKQILSDDGKSQAEKLKIVLEQLKATEKKSDGMVIPANSIRAICANYIISTEHSETSWNAILKDLKGVITKSLYGLSADLLEDELDMDFKEKKSDFKVDYSGGYTWVPDELLPDFLQEERKYLIPLINFFIENLFRRKARRFKMEESILPGLNVQGATLYDIWIAESQLYGSRFENCTFDHVSMARVQMQECHFINCHFKSCALGRADFSHTIFENCTFEEGGGLSTIYTHTKLIDCTFNQVLLGLSDLSQAEIGASELKNCYIGDTKFPEGYLTQAFLDTNYGDRSMKIPKGLKHPGFWPKQCSIPTWYEWLETGKTVESKACLEYK